MSGRAERCWVAVASAEHVRAGMAAGVMQVCHGKVQPLRRMSPGDRIVYYSPTVTFRGKDKLQAFTAIGRVIPGTPYQFDMGGGFLPYRRDVSWMDAHETPIRGLLNALTFTSGDKGWGYRFRFGLFTISHTDMDCISDAMGVSAQVKLRSENCSHLASDNQQF